MPANILIVDDTPENLTVLRDILAREGHKVRPVLQGELALRIAHIEPPDLVLLDVLMPGLNGYQTCERLKADPVTADCPVLFISALDAVGDKLRGFQAGGLDYITKPFQVDEVLARVRTHLALSQAQRQLRQQNAQLADAARLREDVDRILRHDLRGPLANVIAFAELVQRDAQATHPDVADHGRVIGEAAYALLSMVHSSFDLLKMERGDYQASRDAFELGELLGRLLREMQPQAQARQLQLSLARGPHPAWVLGEALLTRSLFHNLLRNALEAAPADSHVTVALQADAPSGWVGVGLRNAGEVPVDIRARFFEKYVTSGKAQGSGLGTYSARLMAHAQGGSVQLDCTEAGHTSLHVKLPAAPAAWPDGNAAQPTPGALRCTQLLVADDDPAIHRYLAHTLPTGLARLTALEGEQAWLALMPPSGAAQATPPSHALIDLHMPGLDGWALVQRYRQAQRSGQWVGASCCLIALSAHQDAATQQRCLSAGFDHVLCKPPSLPALLALLGWPSTEAWPSASPDADLARLVPAFLQSRLEELGRMQQALARGDAAQVASGAHKLHGSLAMYGFDAASALAAGIEQCAHTDLTQAQVLLRDLHSHLVLQHKALP